MYDTLLQKLRHPFVAAWRQTSVSRWRTLPHPEGDPTTHAHGPNADRLLLVGAGIAVGYGVLSHDIALGGHLARRVAEQTHRGAFVNIHAKADFTLADASKLIAELRVSRFDALILACGASEAATLRSPLVWRKQLLALLNRVDSGEQPVHVFVLGVPIMGELTGFYGSLVRQRAALLNAQSEKLCVGRAHATYVELGARDELEPDMSRSAYDRWARVIAPQLVEVLNSIAEVASPREAVDEVRRQQAVDAIDPSNADRDEDLLEVVSAARDLFGVKSAAVHIIDGPVQRVRASVGPAYDQVPREESICDFTIRESAIFVVEDTLLDERFVGKPWAIGPDGVRFYAGFPIESPEGELVGALCILDTVPHRFSESDGALLRQLALRAQSLLWSDVR